MRTALKSLAVLIVMVLIALAAYSWASAGAREPIELQPYYHLSDGEYGLGRVWALDGGWIIDTSNGLIYTCGCGGCDESELLSYATSVSPANTPSADPTPTPPTSTSVIEPTPTPIIEPTLTPEPEDKAKCNRGHRNTNDGEGCDPGHSFGQGKGSGRRAGEDREENE